jgi:hypothetical protein
MTKRKYKDSNKSFEYVVKMECSDDGSMNYILNIINLIINRKFLFEIKGNLKILLQELCHRINPSKPSGHYI